MDVDRLRALGWDAWFEHQLSDDDRCNGVCVRVASHQASQLVCLSEDDEFLISAGLLQRCDPIAVGDWLLLDRESKRGIRRLERRSLIERKAAGAKAERQPIAANVDTMLVVSSCNHDFNLSRLERYLALADQSGVTPVVVLTKADQSAAPDQLARQASRLQHGLDVVVLDARDAEQALKLQPWCGVGHTVSLVGSSGVGKSTLAMSLGAGWQATAGIREDDSKGRHTTTTRSLHRLNSGALLIDNPGMRELQLSECEDGLAEVFEEIVALAGACRFRDCTHQGEPGCAVHAAVLDGDVDPRRLNNFLKLRSEQERNSKTLRQQRHESRKQGRFYKSVVRSKRRRRDHFGEL